MKRQPTGDLMLTVFWTDEEGDHEIPLANPMTRVGRSPEADLRIANPSISRRHAVLLATDGVWTLRDLNSQNGTSVDGRPVREHTISDGDCIRLGEVTLRFVVSVKDSIRLNDALQPEIDASTREFHPGSIVMSASDVASGKSSPASGIPKELTADIAGSLSRLADVAKSLIAADSVESLFSRVLEVVLANTPVESISLLLHDPKINHLVPKASRCRHGKQDSFAISRDIALRVFRQNESILTLDAVDDPRFTSESIMTRGIRSVMCVPLLTHDSTLGVLFAGSTSQRVGLQEYHLHLLTVIANLAAVAIDQARLRQRVEEELLLRSRLTRYHSSTLIDKLIANSASGGLMLPTERNVSVLFADIEGFSTRSERMVPSAVARLLNSLFTELVEIIFAHEGTLDKFLGDGVMAVFGAPNDLPNHARQAVNCALAMQKRVAELDLREGSDTPMRIRIGINSGMAVAGDIGSERRVEYTVLGNTVNIAARLEAFVAQPGETIIGPATQAAIGTSIPTEDLGVQTLKGIREPVPAFRVLG